LLTSPAENVERRIHGGPILEWVTYLPDDDFDGPERRDDVSLGDRPPRPANPHLSAHLALPTAAHDPVRIAQLRPHLLVVAAMRANSPRPSRDQADTRAPFATQRRRYRTSTRPS